MLRWIALFACLAAFAREEAPDCTNVAVLHASPPKVPGTLEQRQLAARDALVAHIKGRPKDAKIIVTPEAFLSMPPGNDDFESAKAALPYAEEIPADPKHWTKEAHPTLVTFSALAVDAKAFLHINLFEKEGEKDKEKVYNTTVVFKPDGTLAAKHRKVHLYKGDKGDETKYITRGEREATFYDAKSVGLGKIGVAICSDIYDPGVGDDRQDKLHLMERYRRIPDLSALAVSACWMLPVDTELGTRGWTPGHFFSETAAYLNAEKGLNDYQRYPVSNFPGAKYDPPALKKPREGSNVHFLVSNQSGFVPGAGILGPDGRRTSPDSYSDKKTDVWITSCLPHTNRAVPPGAKRPH